MLMVSFLDLLMKSFLRILNHAWRKSLKWVWWESSTTSFGLQIKQRSDEIFINQVKYTRELIKKFRPEDVKKSKTPMTITTKLDKDEQGKHVEIKLYRRMIGSLLYLTASRQDIMFSVYFCARFQSCLKESVR